MVNKNVIVIDDTNIENEIWKDIEGSNGKYQVSNMGRVKNIEKGWFMTPSKTNTGSVATSIRINNKNKSYQIKTLVANHFLDKIEGKTAVININGDMLNNKAINLKWVTLNELLSTKVTEHKHNNNNKNSKIDDTDYTNEIWKQLYEHDLYEISNFGRIRNKNNKYIANLNLTDNGYQCAKFQQNTKPITIVIHRMVGKYFIPNLENKPDILHIDKNKLNNKADNLKWVFKYEFNAYMNKITNEMINEKNTNYKSSLEKKYKIDQNKTKINVVEEWKQLKDNPKYQISNFGFIKHIKTGKIRECTIVGGYNTVTINKKTIRLNILVASHFIEIPKELKDIDNIVVDHIDNNKLNDKVDNLRWFTQSDNVHSYNVNYRSYDNCKTVLQYDKQDNFIKEWDNVMDIIKAHPTFHESGIRSVCTNKSITAFNYKWKYKDEREEVILEKDEIFRNCGIINDRDFSNYEISNYGKVKSLKNNIILKYNDTCDYYTVVLYTIDGKEYRCQINILVGELFVLGKFAGAVVNHIDENKLNNHYKNLEWITHRENNVHSFGKAVIMTDKVTGKEIKTFSSIAEACEYVGKEKSSSPNIISSCKEPNRTAFGYKWKYAT